MSTQSDISNTVSDTYDATNNVANIAGREASTLKTQGMQKMDDLASQARQGIDTMTDNASEMKKSIMNYVSEKPGKSLAIGLGAFYLLRKLMR